MRNKKALLKNILTTASLIALTLSATEAGAGGNNKSNRRSASGSKTPVASTAFAPNPIAGTGATTAPAETKLQELQDLETQLRAQVQHTMGPEKDKIREKLLQVTEKRINCQEQDINTRMDNAQSIGDNESINNINAEKAKLEKQKTSLRNLVERHNASLSTAQEDQNAVTANDTATMVTADTATAPATTFNTSGVTLPARARAKSLSSSTADYTFTDLKTPEVALPARARAKSLSSSTADYTFTDLKTPEVALPAGARTKSLSSSTEDEAITDKTLGLGKVVGDIETNTSAPIPPAPPMPGTGEAKALQQRLVKETEAEAFFMETAQGMMAMDIIEDDAAEVDAEIRRQALIQDFYDKKAAEAESKARALIPPAPPMPGTAEGKVILAKLQEARRLALINSLAQEEVALAEKQSQLQAYIEQARQEQQAIVDVLKAQNSARAKDQESATAALAENPGKQKKSRLTKQLKDATAQKNKIEAEINAAEAQWKLQEEEIAAAQESYNIEKLRIANQKNKATEALLKAQEELNKYEDELRTETEIAVTDITEIVEIRTNVTETVKPVTDVKEPVNSDSTAKPSSYYIVADANIPSYLAPAAEILQKELDRNSGNIEKISQEQANDLYSKAFLHSDSLNAMAKEWGLDQARAKHVLEENRNRFMSSEEFTPELEKEMNSAKEAEKYERKQHENSAAKNQEHASGALTAAIHTVGTRMAVVATPIMVAAPVIAPTAAPVPSVAPVSTVTGNTSGTSAASVPAGTVGGTAPAPVSANAPANDSSGGVSGSSGASTTSVPAETSKENGPVTAPAAGVVDTNTNDDNDVDVDLEASAAGIAAGDAYERFGAWVQVVGGVARQKERKGAAGFNSDLVGGMVGVDTLISDRTMIGLAFGNMVNNVKQTGKEKGDKSKSSSLVFSAYGNQQLEDNWFIRGSLAYTKTAVDNKDLRTISSVKQGIARAKYNINSIGGEVTVGKSLPMQNGLVLVPSLGVRFTHTDKISYQETGNTGLNHKSSQKASNVSEGIAGLQVMKMFEKNGVIFTPEAHANIQYGLGVKAPTGKYSVQGSTQAIAYVGTKPGRLSSVIGVGLTAESGSIEYGIGYDANIAAGYLGHQGSLKLKVKF